MTRATTVCCLFSLDLERVNILQETPGLRLPRDDGGDRSGQMLGGVLCLHYDYDGQPRYPAVAGTGQLACWQTRGDNLLAATSVLLTSNI